MNQYTRAILTKAKKFKAEVNEVSRMVTIDNPVTIKNRADALDAIFLLRPCDDWTCCDQGELLEALRCFIEKLPEAPEKKTKRR